MNKIIRCIDCDNYRVIKGTEVGYCEGKHLEADISNNDFCSRAVPRGEGTEIFVDDDFMGFGEALKRASEAFYNTSLSVDDFANKQISASVIDPVFVAFSI